MLLVHSEIYYIPIGDGWEEVLVRNVFITLCTSTSPWTQTLNLPPPGIEPESPASQVGTLPKELSRQHIPVLRIRDVYPESRIRLFSIPDPGSDLSQFRITDPHKRI